MAGEFTTLADEDAAGVVEDSSVSKVGAEEPGTLADEEDVAGVVKDPSIVEVGTGEPGTLADEEDVAGDLLTALLDESPPPSNSRRTMLS